MPRIDELPADQRAALQLLLKQGRTYDEIAQLLRIDERAVRERARAALDALGPEDVDDLDLNDQDEIADYLLGQQSASQRAETRLFLEGSASGRAWARTVSGELRPLAGDNLPEIPSEAAEVDEAFDALQARTVHRERTEQSSRVGGAILLVGLAVVLVVALLWATGAFSGDDEGDKSGKRTATTATTQTGTQAQPTIEAQINLVPPQGSGSKAVGVAQIASQTANGKTQRAVLLAGQDLPAATKESFYGIWLYDSPTKAKFLGFPDPQPAKDGRLGTTFELKDEAKDYTDLVVTRETVEKPTKPGTIVLRGPLAGNATPQTGTTTNGN
jgi:hypothetical protein